MILETIKITDNVTSLFNINPIRISTFDKKPLSGGIPAKEKKTPSNIKETL